MKKNYKLISIIIILLVLICIVISNDNKEIKTIKSEKELLNIYNNRSNNNLSFIEKALLLPFSITLNEYSYGGQWDDITTYNDVAQPEATKGSSSTKDYSKTNIQVEGVDEADIIKTDGDYIYSISNKEVLITNVKDPKDIKVVSRLENDIPQDLLLYKDKLIVISSSTSENYRYYYRANNTIVTIYNISNKKDPKKVKTFTLNADYHTTRCIDGNLYIFSNGYLRKDGKKVDRSYEEDNNKKEIKLNNIKYLTNNKSNYQTLIAEVDLNKISNIRLNSYLIDISNAYVSKENIYLLDTKYSSDKIKISSLFTLKGVIGFFHDLNRDSYEQKTRIYKFKINKNKGVELKDTTQVKGNIINQYSLDEKDGNLRIALHTNDGSRIAVLDKNLNLLGETPNLAKGETMYASRFMDNKAYLVTYRNTDPLFVIDLSKPNKPKVLGELKIPGYSTYLHPYDENHLIGIGMDTKEIINRDSSGKVISSWTRIVGMKMALFDVSDVSNPKEIDKTTIGDEYTVSAVLSNPKALLFSKEKNLLAIPVNNYREKFQVRTSNSHKYEEENYTENNKYISEGYIVYNINLKGFKQRGIITHQKSNEKDYYSYNRKLLRGLYIEDNLYTISEDYIKVNDLKDLKEISNIKVNKEGEI